MNAEFDSKGALQSGYAFNGTSRLQVVGYRFAFNYQLKSVHGVIMCIFKDTWMTHPWNQSNEKHTNLSQISGNKWESWMIQKSKMSFSARSQKFILTSRQMQMTKILNFVGFHVLLFVLDHIQQIPLPELWRGQWFSTHAKILSHGNGVQTYGEFKERALLG